MITHDLLKNSASFGESPLSFHLAFKGLFQMPEMVISLSIV